LKQKANANAAVSTTMESRHPTGLLKMVALFDPRNRGTLRHQHVPARIRSKIKRSIVQVAVSSRGMASVGANRHQSVAKIYA
jgi:hypothetical protein